MEKKITKKEFAEIALNVVSQEVGDCPSGSGAGMMVVMLTAMSVAKKIEEKLFTEDDMNEITIVKED